MATVTLPATRGTSVAPVRRTSRRGRFFVPRLILAVLATLVILFPLYWMVVTALSTQKDLYSPGLHLWPQHLTWSNFSQPVHDFPVWTWFRNSTLIAVAVTAITVSCNLLAGYAFAKLRFRGRNALFLLLLSTMMIPVQAIMIAQFKFTIHLGLYGNVWAVILPESATVFGIFLARQFFLAIPDELIEAARVDGAGQLRIFRSIVLPLCRPLLAVLTLLTAMSEWNAFAWPLVVLFGNHELFTLPIGMVTDLQGQYSSNYGAIMAMSLLMISPLIVLFVLFQRYFVQGLARSGIK
ncbi:multiple sugar transport system permease protein/alpha-1,4-digalacturonate transport system permease protein [Jatrophihabitans endophyticus]|uniref:Multiple sugar transport system permease protein/alpha-1,4-digalacturonate transport system permease protein n=1 Tax=Jatrophihabitans endophyticus TaxID=1206085 RepID=A0A1M5CKJ9_9ACTN|nr:carbohydrate ABC transporter permease [Jatrophihabitans endophyticus]SHF55137.1 multiple sugar transport system permease protein/alpha-1,4-digalacturonate transport system permease protein [Jatrophihabitans endophyticus]